jgi:hypothetical protein
MTSDFARSNLAGDEAGSIRIAFDEHIEAFDDVMRGLLHEYTFSFFSTVLGPVVVQHKFCFRCFHI